MILEKFTTSFSPESDGFPNFDIGPFELEDTLLFFACLFVSCLIMRRTFTGNRFCNLRSFTNCHSDRLECKLQNRCKVLRQIWTIVLSKFQLDQRSILMGKVTIIDMKNSPENIIAQYTLKNSWNH